MSATPGETGTAVTSAEDTPPVLKGFTITRLLGQGGMAAVWEARRDEEKVPCALKVMDSAMSEDPEDVKRFVEEARLAKTLNHENLVQVFDVACHNGINFYVMELVRGYDTNSWLLAKGRIEPMEALGVAESIAAALAYAWEQAGLIHCDIKPANIMVDADGTVKLTDLGVARSLRGRVRRDGDDTHITGTSSYMAPEQITGATPLDYRTDMYGLGATLYHLVTGHKLFSGGTDNEIMEWQVSAQAPDARDWEPALSEPYVAMLEKLLAKDPAHRPRNWNEVLQDMRLVRGGLFPIGTTPPPGGSSMFRHSVAATLAEDDDDDDNTDPETALPAAQVPARRHRLPPFRPRSLSDGGSMPRPALIALAFLLFLIALIMTLAILRWL